MARRADQYGCDGKCLAPTAARAGFEMNGDGGFAEARQRI